MPGHPGLSWGPDEDWADFTAGLARPRCVRPCNREFLPSRIWCRGGGLACCAGGSAVEADRSKWRRRGKLATLVTGAWRDARKAPPGGERPHHERDRPRDAGGGAERPAAGGERDGPHVRARRLLPGDLRGLRPLRRDLRQGQWRRHRPGRAGPADLRRRDAVHHACGDRSRAGGRRSASTRRHLHHQRPLCGRHPSHGREDGEAVLLSRPPVGVSVEHRALARHRGLGAGGLLVTRDGGPAGGVAAAAREALSRGRDAARYPGDHSGEYPRARGAHRRHQGPGGRAHRRREAPDRAASTAMATRR